MSKLSEYIQKELKKGFSLKQVKSALLKVGYKEDLIDEAIKEVNDYEFPQHKHRRIPNIWIIVLGIFAIMAVFVIVLLYLPLGNQDSEVECAFLPKSQQSECYTNKAILDDNLELCRFVYTNQYLCFSQFAIRDENFSICNGNFECVVEYGKAFNDDSVCDNVLESNKGLCTVKINEN